MTTKQICYGGVTAALCAVCIISASGFGIVFPLLISCAVTYYCAIRQGAVCATVSAAVANLIAFAFFGITAEFLFNALLFSPFSILVFVTRGLRGKRILIRWVVFLAFAAAVYALFVTVFTAIIGIKSDDFVFVGVWGFGVIWSIAFAAFGFVFEKAIDMVAARFKI